MTTLYATNLATNIEPSLSFSIDFDKKKLTKLAQDCQAHHQRLQSWLVHPILAAHFNEIWQGGAPKAIYALTWGDSQNANQIRLDAITKAINNPPYFQDTTLMETMRKGLRKNNTPARLLLKAGLLPVPAEQIMDTIESFMIWRKNHLGRSLAPLYHVLLTIYYFTLIQPMGAIQTAMNFVLLHQTLQKLHFGVIADRIVEFYAKNENIVADTLAMCFHAREKKYHQHPWYQLFFEAWTWALDEMEKDIQIYCLQACFHARAKELLENKTLNERQYQLLMQLEHEKTIRDKKSLNLSMWYRVLYKDLTKRTQERDFNILCEQGFVQIIGKNEFVLMDA